MSWVLQYLHGSLNDGSVANDNARRQEFVGAFICKQGNNHSEGDSFFNLHNYNLLYDLSRVIRADVLK